MYIRYLTTLSPIFCFRNLASTQISTVTTCCSHVMRTFHYSKNNLSFNNAFVLIQDKWNAAISEVILSEFISQEKLIVFSTSWFLNNRYTFANKDTKLFLMKRNRVAMASTVDLRLYYRKLFCWKSSFIFQSIWLRILITLSRKI